MNIKKMLTENAHLTGVSGFFCAYGSFGVADGSDTDLAKAVESEMGFSAEYDKFSVKCELKEYENGVYSRNDYFTAKEDLVLNCYNSRFYLENGDYEVYTQFSSWQNESMGSWQDLVTGIEVSNHGIRTTHSATPMLAVHNKGNGKIYVFHLLPNAKWKIKISRVAITDRNNGVIIETGINEKGLNMKVKKGETIEMPQLFVFEAKSKIDLDAWKLHIVYNRLHPRKNLPVLYNSWLLKFDQIDVEDILRQADTAADIGVEQFLIDAGWFGSTENWGNEIGNWEENLVGGFHGRLMEVAEHVRSKGMKFGMWLEPERALKCTKAYENHPEYYREGNDGYVFLDFANDEAREYITNITLGLIEKYKLGFMKFDFNASLSFDSDGDGFYRYLKGAKQFVADVRAKFPDLYITNCASGGTRMDLYQQTIYDSIWYSDNQSPIAGIRIVKDTALRLPPCHLEKWDVRRYLGGVPKYACKELVSLPVSCHNATWDSVCSVTPEYTHAFLTGSPIGFSTDIASYPEEERKALKEHIAQFKRDREFYKNATLRIIHDAKGITVLQYSDTELNRAIIQVFTDVALQYRFTFYPVLSENKTYIFEGKEYTAKELYENGIEICIADIDCKTFEFKAK